MDEHEEAARALAAFASGGPKADQPGMCFECSCYFDRPRIEPVDDTHEDFFCPHCGDHFARWPRG